MRTVQEILKDLDPVELIDTYLCNNPIPYEDSPDKTVREIRESHIRRLSEYVVRLQNIEIKPPEDGRTAFFYVHRCIKDEFDDVRFRLIHLDEFRDKGYDCQSYAYEFQEQAEIVGYKVAETPLMQKHIYTLMSEVLEEASFFGFEQQHLQKERDELDRRIKSIEDGTAELIEHDLVIDDEESPDEKELHSKVWDARLEYEANSMRKELEAVKELLVKEGTI